MCFGAPGVPRGWCFAWALGFKSWKSAEMDGVVSEGSVDLLVLYGHMAEYPKISHRVYLRFCK